MPTSSLGLPTELWRQIFDSYPPATLFDETGPVSIARCARVCRRFHHISDDDLLWYPHYIARWPHPLARTDVHRRPIDRSHARHMYLVRRALDAKAVICLENILNASEPAVRHENAAVIANELGFDVLDAISLLCSIPLPDPLSDPLRSAWKGPVYADALSRRYWSKQLRGLIFRRTGVKTWSKLVSATEGEKPIQFEDAMIALSTVCGEDPFELKERFEALKKQCEAYLKKECIPFVSSHPSFNLTATVDGICTWMRSVGFLKANAEEYHLLSNHFPHRFLTTHRRTLPMSLVCVFVSLARHVGLNASPVNFPNKVIAHVSNPDRNKIDIWVDVYNSDTECILDMDHALREVSSPTSAREDLLSWIRPAAIQTMLVRTSRNIYASVVMAQSLIDPNPPDQHLAIYTVACLMVLFSGDPSLMSAVLTRISDFSLDSKAIFLDTIIPALGDHPSLTEVKAMFEGSIKTNSIPHIRPPSPMVRYSVGQCMRHKIYGYHGVIFGWDMTCMQSEAWIIEMQVDQSLARGRNQPFYHVFATEGSPRYVAEDNVEIAVLTPDQANALIVRNDEIGKHFTSVYVTKSGALKGLIPNEMTKYAYPNDEGLVR